MKKLAPAVVAALFVSPAAVSQVFGLPSKFTAAGASRSFSSFAEGGLALYFAENIGCGRVFVIRRSSLSGGWGKPAIAYESSPGACGARVSQDGLELFAYGRVGAVRQILRSVRPSTSVKFPALKPVTELAHKDQRGPGCLSADGLTLYYWQTLTGFYGGHAVRPAKNKPFVDKGKVANYPLSWVSDDQRVGLTWGLVLVRRHQTGTFFTVERSAGSVKVPWGHGAPTFLPETGELIYWRDSSSGHELMIAKRKDSLVNYSAWKPGGLVDLDIYGRPTETWMLAIAATEHRVPFPPFGTLRIGTPLVVVGLGTIPSLKTTWSKVQDPSAARYTLPLPTNTPIGAKGFFQALTVNRGSPIRGSLTNLVIGQIQ